MTAWPFSRSSHAAPYVNRPSSLLVTVKNKWDFYRVPQQGALLPARAACSYRKNRSWSRALDGCVNRSPCDALTFNIRLKVPDDHLERGDAYGNAIETERQL